MERTRALRSNVAVLFSERSRRIYATQAQQAGQTYRYTDAWGTHREWLKGEYAYLAVNAMSAVLHRYGVKHDIIGEDELADHLDAYHTLFLPNAGHLEESDAARIAAWLDQPNRFLVVSGKTNLPPHLLGLARCDPVCPHGYTGWRWTPPSPFSDSADWEEFYISSYRGYTCAVAAAAPGATVLADLYELSGDLRSAATAAKRHLGDAIIATERTVYFANQVFEYLGGIMQAHVNVEEVRMWSNPTHWGDTLAYFVREILRATAANRMWDASLLPFGTYNGVLQLRHDVDHDPDESIDLTMLECEAQNAAPATYYLLDPAFCTTRCTPMGVHIWREATARYNFIEAALHNDSVEGDPPQWITGRGLHEHVQASNLNLGLRSQTAGRHMGFLVYPETIDAMDYLYEHDPDFLGLCTFSLYDVLEYGHRNPDVIVGGKQLTYRTYDHADPARPAAIPGVWFPYHAVVSTVDRQKTLRGWDVTHDTDCDYERIETLFAGRHSKNPGHPGRLENGVFTLQYETQLARHPFQNKGRGHLPWLRYAISHAQRCDFWLANKRMLYTRMNDYQDLAFRVEEDGILALFNPTERLISGLMVRLRQPVNYVADGEWLHVHVVGQRTFTLPVLLPGQEVRLQTRWQSVPPPLIPQPNTNLLEIVRAQYHPGRGELHVQARAIRKSYLVVRNLPPDTASTVRVTDSRGSVHTTLATRPDGTLAITILGQQDNVIPIEVVMTPA